MKERTSTPAPQTSCSRMGTLPVSLQGDRIAEKRGISLQKEMPDAADNHSDDKV